MKGGKKMVIINNDVAGWRCQTPILPETTGANVISKLLADHVIDNDEYRIVYYNKKIRYTLLVDLDKPISEQIPALSEQASDHCPVLHLIPPSRETPLAALFLGPKAENGDILTEAVNNVLSDYIYWRKNYFPKDTSAVNSAIRESTYDFFDDFNTELQGMLNELKEGFPFHSPRYLGHMLSGQTLPAIVGYFAGMLYNPNNVTDEAAPVTVSKEIEYGKMICQMIGYTANSWAHICSGGTLANLEALWVARLVQFLPLCIQDLCAKQKWDYKIKTPNFPSTKEKRSILCLSPRELLSLSPNESLFMTSNLLKYLISGESGKKYSLDVAIKTVNSGINESKYNIRTYGLSEVINNITAKSGKRLKPVFFIPESAHYSFKKAVNLLGYGESSVHSIPIDTNFRINVDKLEEMLFSIKDDEYIGAVVAVVGTTEEGAVDPVHKVKWLRDRLCTEQNRSFWLHVDSAWGGFVRTLFCDDYSQNRNSAVYNRAPLEDYSTVDFKEKVQKMVDHINAVEEMYLFDTKKSVKIQWSDSEVYSAYMAMSSADSVTVDPHKLGYVPYPAGVIAFKNKLVTALVAQDAPYISTSDSKIAQIDIKEINAVGSYIIEGSKPGATALSCWFSAKMIPLDLHHHGKIIKTSLLNAKRLAYYLSTYHNNLFKKNDHALITQGYFSTNSTRPFVFKLLYNNIDTNVVCFMVIPAYWSKTKKDKLDLCKWDLQKVNKLNEEIYRHFTINALTRDNDRKVTLSQRFFVSKTVLGNTAYNYQSIKTLLDDLGYTEGEYLDNGLFVMRLTVMNPWYHLTKKNNGTDYFLDFLKELHYQSRRAIERFDATPSNLETI